MFRSPNRISRAALPAVRTEDSGRGRLSPRHLGLYVLFASLTVLFGASLVAYWVTRAQSSIWRTPEMPKLPSGLWVSSALIAGVSAAFQSALNAARRNRSLALMQRLWLGTGLVGLFLSAQLRNWLFMKHGMFQAHVDSLYPYTFYLLTGLHAFHVLAGFIPLSIVLYRAHRREYSSSHHEGVLLCVQYWHYLGVVWLVLFSALELFT